MAIGEEENYRRAAQRLNVAQTALSTQIQDLEALNASAISTMPDPIPCIGFAVSAFPPAPAMVRAVAARYYFLLRWHGLYVTTPLNEDGT